MKSQGPDLHWKIMWEVDLAGLKHTHLRLVPNRTRYIYLQKGLRKVVFLLLVDIDLI